jgi:predicted RNA-binding Zn-ribbon protein involved in translation (DUF1610 family)
MNELNIKECESCKNITLIDKSMEHDLIFICPICGIINDNHAPKKLKLYLVKDGFTADSEKASTGTLDVHPKLDSVEEKAFQALMDKGWKMHFKFEKEQK